MLWHIYQVTQKQERALHKWGPENNPVAWPYNFTDPVVLKESVFTKGISIGKQCQVELWQAPAR